MNRLSFAFILVAGCSQPEAKPTKQPDQPAPTIAPVSPPAAAPMPAPAVTGPAESWHDASKGAIDVNGVKLEIISVKIGHPQKVTLKGQILDAKGKNPSVMVTYRVTNGNDTKRFVMPAWGTRIWDAKGGPELQDEFGNDYKRSGSLGVVPVRTVGQLEAGKTMNVGDSGQDMLVFPEPIAKAETLKLDLPGDVVGAKDRVKIQIPKSMWR